MKQDDMVSAAYAQGRRDQRESDEALLRKALEAMEYSGMDVGKFNRINAACQALRAALAEPVQSAATNIGCLGMPVNTPVTQPQRKPLTDEEIKACEQQAMVNGALPFEQRVFFARAIERAHGIKENS